MVAAWLLLIHIFVYDVSSRYTNHNLGGYETMVSPAYGASSLIPGLDDMFLFIIGGGVLLCVCVCCCPCIMVFFTFILPVILIILAVITLIILSPAILVFCLPCILLLCLFCCGVCIGSKFGRFKLDDLDKLEMKQKRSSKKGAKIKINKQLFEIKYEDIHVEDIIGEGGSSAIVYLAKYNRMKVAFKCFRISPQIDQAKFEEFEREAEILVSVNHPNILGCYGCSIHLPRVGIVLEYCAKGDVKEFFLEKGENKKFEERMMILDGVCLAMIYLHAIKVIHRDLKWQNVLLDKAMTPKVMDFGASRIYEEEDQTKTSHIGTCFYMAPEIVRSRKYTDKCDVFSFAIMMWEIMLNDFEPYGGSETYGIELKVANNPHYRPPLRNLKQLEGNKKLQFPHWMRNVCERCWDAHPRSRYTFKEVHDIFTRKVPKLRMEEEKEKKKEEKIKKKNILKSNTKKGPTTTTTTKKTTAVTRKKKANTVHGNKVSSRSKKVVSFNNKKKRKSVVTTNSARKK